MPRRRQAMSRGGRRRQTEPSQPAPPPSERIRHNGRSAVHEPEGEVFEALIGGEKLSFYAHSGRHPRVSTEGLIRQVAIGAVELANDLSNYVNALCREVVLLRGEIDEIRTELGHVPVEQDGTQADTVPLDTTAGDIEAPDEPYDPKPVSVVGDANPAGAPVNPDTLPDPEPVQEEDS